MARRKSGDFGLAEAALLGAGGFLLYKIISPGTSVEALTTADLAPEAQVAQSRLADGGATYKSWLSRVMQLYQAFSAGTIDGDRAKALDLEYKDGIGRDFMNGLLTVNDKMNLVRYMPLNS